MAQQLQQKRGRPEKGYAWTFFYVTPAWMVGLLVTVLMIGAGSLFYVWYCQAGNDIAPDSMVGFGYAIAGTLCVVLAATLYMFRRRGRKRTAGRLNAALNWHVFCAVIGFAFVLMHSFGNFNAKTGTYALYGLIALMVNGFTGRLLDRVLPRLMAAEMSKMLTWQGKDRLEIISRNLQAAPLWPPTSTRQAVQAWDVGYVSLRADPTKFAVQWEEDSLAEMRAVQRAMFREQVYRSIIRYWRRLHVALALVSVGLIIWHLVYVTELLVPMFFRGPGR